jgi:nitrate reductase NapE component
LKKILAQIISVFTHPVFMPIIGCWMLYTNMPHLFESIEKRIFNGWIMMMIINTILFPTLTVLLLKGLGFVKSIQLKEPRERIIPLIGTMIFYFWPYLVAKNVGVPDAGRMLLLGNFWGIIVVFIATIFFKISWHTTGVGSLLGLAITLSIIIGSPLWLWMVSILALGLIVALARKSLNAHNNIELILGAIVGIITQIGAYFFIF